MKITVEEVLREGNWSSLSWSPRLANETEFQEFVGELAARAAAYVEWRAGSANYGDTSEPLASILKEAEMHVCQEQMLLSAAGVAEAARDPGNPPFLGAGEDLRAQARHRRERAEALLGPYVTAPPPDFARPAARTGTGTPPLTESFFDEVEGRVAGSG